MLRDFRSDRNTTSSKLSRFQALRQIPSVFGVLRRACVLPPIHDLIGYRVPAGRLSCGMCRPIFSEPL